jgi:hypothetical protein
MVVPALQSLGRRNTSLGGLVGADPMVVASLMGLTPFDAAYHATAALTCTILQEHDMHRLVALALANAKREFLDCLSFDLQKLKCRSLPFLLE